MDHEIIHQKFDSLRRCIERVESKNPITIDQLEVDYDLQDIISVNLERAIQNSIDIAAIVSSYLKGPTPETMAECFDVICRSKVISSHIAERMKKATGFRNLLVHEYTKVDWKIVFSIATKHLNDFRSFVKEVDAWMIKKNSS